LAELRVPEEIAVLGVDNDELECELTDPSLSSVLLNTDKTGYEVAESLDHMMKGEDQSGKLITVNPQQVISRRSTDIFVMEDLEVAKAVKFIRERAMDLIQMDDVVDAVSISKRSLQNRFKQVLGRSVSDEIRRVRADMVAKMLVGTNLTVSQIVNKLGLVGYEHISRMFKKEKGMSPNAYRQKYGSL
jgi:LacI family transcriptional regulator